MGVISVMSKLTSKLYFCLITMSLAGCAKMGTPEGGPRDETPPRIVETIPAAGSVNVDPDAPVIVRFDERISRTSLANAFTLSPAPPGKVTVKWAAREVELRFDPPLLSDRTYVLTLGTQLSDIRNIKLKDSFHLAFSTGDKLDMGRVVGDLVSMDGPVQGWYVAAYLLEDESAMNIADTTSSHEKRTPNPAFDIPDAATQAAADGSWDLRNLRPGKWRLFAFNDNDDDHLWTPTIDKLAVPWRDVVIREIQLPIIEKDTVQIQVDSLDLPDIASLDSMLMDTLEPELIPSDTITLVGYKRPSLPQPTRASARIRNIVEIRFDRALSSLDGVFEILANSTVDDVNYDPGDSTKARLKLNRMLEGDSVIVTISGSFGATDSLDTLLTVDLRNSADVDTFPPRFLTTRPKEGSTLFQGFDTIELIFNEEMNTPDSGAILLVGSNDDTLDYELKIMDGVSWKIFPRIDGQVNLINISIFGDRIHDLAGNTILDSVTTIGFLYLSPDSLGKISGNMIAETQFRNIHIVFKALNGKYPPLQTVIEKPSSYLLNSVPAGDWKMECWSDLDSNGVFDIGIPEPFIPAEPFILKKDTIFVRARWESGENNLIFR
ncbi:Ig-like domain-containing protein [Calditrichota bacterium]